MNNSEATAVMQNAVNQAGSAIMEVMIKVLVAVAIMVAVGICFYAIKAAIKKKLKSSKSGAISKTSGADDIKYTLDDDQLEELRLYMKLTDEDQSAVKEQMKQMLKVRKRK